MNQHQLAEVVGRADIKGLVLSRLTPHESASWPLVSSKRSLEILPAFCPQITPRRPLLPILPTRKYRILNNLRGARFHGMEEVIGSIPIRSTK